MDEEMAKELFDLPKEYWAFDILGSSKTKYNVVISPEECSCTCPDFFIRKMSCKHIYFVISRIACKDNLLGKITSEMKIDEESWKVLDKNIMEKLKNRINGCDAVTEVTKQYRENCTECAICFEEFTNNKFDSCSNCSNRFHTECINKWLSTNKYNPSCPLCRTVWTPKDETTDVLAYMEKLTID